ncbi:hypothetical protein [Streptomyces albireticuli]|uniref:hypothetical protein n=1 Tax=Streptomyces albireticuli TaxID=1940 RepID=UPI001473667F|nr:hypothetical protein [Streptomyces albireticuli]MCD9193399.1 hypothetical protein [Streptomyces albireticuli]
MDGVVAGEQSLQSFVPISLGVPTLTVDTSDGYQPGVQDIIAFLRASADEGASPAPTSGNA